jgi:hypothetical protein
MSDDTIILIMLEPPLEPPPMRAFCRCALDPSGAGCMRRLRLRRRGNRRHRGRRCGHGARNAGGDDGGDGGGDGPPAPARARGGRWS